MATTTDIKVTDLEARTVFMSSDVLLVSDTESSQSYKVTYSTLSSNIAENVSEALSNDSFKKSISSETWTFITTDNVSVEYDVLFNGKRVK